MTKAPITPQWVPALGARHATTDRLFQPRWLEVSTLCGLRFTPDHKPDKTEWLWHTCPDCNTIWRSTL